MQIEAVHDDQIDVSITMIELLGATGVTASAYLMRAHDDITWPAKSTFVMVAQDDIVSPVAVVAIHDPYVMVTHIDIVWPPVR